MGWFDKNSWKRRKKLNDLLSELSKAESEGKYIREDGLYFAELQDMGNATMVIFAGSDSLAAQEEDVIKSFFDRNGFTVDSLKISADGLALDKVEIIPHDELIRNVGRALKVKGFRLIDDSEKEIAPALSENIIPLSALVRTITGLFAKRVEDIVKQTKVKMNKEGNRLLQWLPKIAEASFKKVPEDMTKLIEPLFNNAYENLYATAVVKSPAEVSLATGSLGSSESTGFQPENDSQNIERFKDFLKKLVGILVRSTPNQCISNSQALLGEINTFFKATSTVLLLKPLHKQGLAIFAKAGKDLTWGAGKSAEGGTISEMAVADCVKTDKTVTQQNSNSFCIALPIELNNVLCGILYLERAFMLSDISITLLERVTHEIFEEFPDYTLGIR